MLLVLIIILALWIVYLVKRGYGEGGFFIGFIGFFVLFGASFIIPTFGHVSVDYPLEAIQDGTGLSGSFFLGSGVINNEASFTFYQQEGDSFVLKSVPGWRAKVKYTTAAPHATWRCRDENPRWWFAPFGSGEPSIYCGRRASVTFYVPQGTIVNNYSLDAK